MNLVTTCQPMNGGADAAAGRGMNFNLTLSGSWAIGDLISLTFTDALTALQTLIGAGFVSGVAPTYVFTFKEKIYALARSSMYFTAVGSALIWNDPNAAGNGFLTLSNSFGISEDLQAVGVFQGKLAVASRNTVQVWTVDPDPALNAGGQVLSNIGTFAKDSLQSIGIETSSCFTILAFARSARATLPATPAWKTSARR